MPKLKPVPHIPITPFAAKTALIYSEALLEACAKHGVDPVKLLVDTADYPKVARLEMVEFMVGWFHGVAEAYGALAEQLWAQVCPAPAIKDGNVRPDKRQRVAAIREGAKRRKAA